MGIVVGLIATIIVITIIFYATKAVSNVVKNRENISNNVKSPLQIVIWGIGILLILITSVSFFDKM